MRKQLCKYLEQGHVFEWGSNDCCLFAANWVLSVTGVDYMSEFRGSYTDLDSARLIVKRVGNGNLYRTMQVKFGGAVKRGAVGDVAYSWQDEGPSLGICAGEYSIFLGDGLVKVPNIECRFFKWVKL